MTEEQGNNICFVISPIGNAGSPIREAADDVLKGIIIPAMEPFGYEVIRAEQIPGPGSITSDIVQHLRDDELVIADLTNHNPNVFYELAIRHAINKPVIMITNSNTEWIPFDIAQDRVIHYETSLRHTQQEIRNIREAVTAIRDNSTTPFDNPISRAIQVLELASSPDSTDQGYALILERLDQIARRSGNPLPPSQSSSPVIITNSASHEPFILAVIDSVTKLMRLDALPLDDTYSISTLITQHPEFTTYSPLQLANAYLYVKDKYMVDVGSPVGVALFATSMATVLSD